MKSHARHYLHGLAARSAILAASTWTAAIQLWSVNSLAYKAAGSGVIIDAANVAMLCLCALGWADVVWHDIGGRLIWPKFSARLRHHVCVYLYSALALGFGMRAFLAAGEDMQATLVVGSYYLLFAMVALLEPLAMAGEDRKDAP